MICPACNRDIPLSLSGELAKHRRTKRSRAYCPSSGLKAGPSRKQSPKKAKARPARKIVRECPTHQQKLVARQTSWGWRWHCPAENCTVCAWGGSTSTPADYETRQKRIAAHDSFDTIWADKSNGIKRGELYKHLAEYMGLAQEQCHIGMFTGEQCEQVIEFCSQLAAANPHTN